MNKNKFFIFGMLAVLLTFGIMITACGGGGGGGGGDPKKVVENYLAAASAGKFNDAKKYLTGDALEKLEEDLKKVGDNKEYLAAAGALLGAIKVLDVEPEIDGDKAVVSCSGLMGGTQKFHLVKVGGSWKIEKT
ncbi:hypothetical protein AGMMS50230_01840 [Spirochaetia bacterium]|nr:hypothetical protein AGMMS50230_01840 [Spirochaetia bacterium]